MYTMYAGWDSPLNLLKAEIMQKEYEGYPVRADIKARIKSLDSKEDAFNQEKISELWKALSELPLDPDFKYIQPNDLDEIRKLRPDGPRKLKMDLSDEELLDRLHGAWTGRAVGCALGKPVEALGMRGAKGLNGRESIKSYLKNRGHWPLDYYFSGEENEDGIKLFCPQSLRENIRYMEPDDDIHYTLIGLKVLEESGPDFKWYDVARSWNSSLPYYAICTAETQAIMNFNLRAPQMSVRMGTFENLPGLTPEFTRTHNNPYREWIGAMIRADGWAYSALGMPELAAEFAYRDACWTHTANGLYGEMFIAALIASAFVENDPAKLIEIGLSEIPPDTRFSEAVADGLSWVETEPDFESFMLKVEEKYGKLSPVHTINNVLIVMAALFYGQMDPDKSICLAVSGGLDTDCNGATVGSIVGAAKGYANFGGKLAPTLNDTIKPLVFGFQEISMQELAQRSFAVYQSIKA